MTRLLRRWLVLVLIVVLLVGGAIGGIHVRASQLRRQGETFMRQRDYAKALESLEASLRWWPGQAQVLLDAARSARRLKRFDLAAKYVRQAGIQGVEAGTLEVERLLADVERNHKESMAWLRQRASEDDSLAPIILEVLIQKDIDDYRLIEALHGLHRYLECRPDDLAGLLARGFVWERFLYFADARNDYQRAVEHHPDSPEARLRLGKMLLLTSTPEKALEQFVWLEERYPRRQEVLLGIAQCRRRLGNHEEASQRLDEYLQEWPRDMEALWERGQLALETSHPDQAEPLLRRALDLAPFDRRVNYSLSRCLAARGAIEESEKYRKRADRIDADLLRLNQISKEVMASPDNIALRYEGGMIFLNNGEPGEGQRWLERVLELDPGHQQARAALSAARSGVYPVPGSRTSESMGKK